MDILKSIAHPDEVMALFKYKHGSTQVVQSRLDEVGLHVYVFIYTLEPQNDKWLKITHESVKRIKS